VRRSIVILLNCRMISDTSEKTSSVPTKFLSELVNCTHGAILHPPDSETNRFLESLSTLIAKHPSPSKMPTM
jgi:hypothetical protein